MASISLLYRRGFGDLPAQLIYAALQAASAPILIHSDESITESDIRDSSRLLIMLTPGSLDRCVDAGDPLRTALEASRAAQKLETLLVSPHFPIADQAIYVGNLLDEAHPIAVEYSSFGETIARLCNHLGFAPPEVNPSKEDLAKLDAQSHYELALRLPSADLLGKIAAYTDAINTYDAFGEAYARRAGAQLAADNPQACLEDCQAALQHNPNLVEAYHNRGMAYSKLEKYQEAAAAYSEALRLAPKNIRLYVNRGVVRAHLNDHDGAIADYTAALEINPNLAEAYFNRSLSHNARDNFEAAIKDYSQAMALNLSSTQILRASDGNLSSTIAYLERLLRRYPHHPKAEEIRAEIERLQRFGRATGEIKPPPING
ncbi:MAG: hypothetical protein OHK0023_28880 [Anaerolineae bacterium]